MAASDIKTKLRYAVDTGDRPYVYSYTRSKGERAERPDRKDDIPTDAFREVEVVVRDARKESLSLDKNAFQLVEHESSLTPDEFYTNEEKVKTVYYQEISDLVKKSTGAEHTFLIHHQVRNKDKSVVSLFGPGIHDYVYSIQSDTSPFSAEKLLTYVLLTVPVGEEILTKTRGKGRFLYLNAWRNISETPVADNHLAVCDETSTVKPDDYIISDFVDREYTIQKYSLGDRNSAKHCWYYYPGMKKNEVLLLKQWDSDTTQTGRVAFHTAFKNPNAPADAPTRESIEVGVVVYLPDYEPNTCPEIDAVEARREYEDYLKWRNAVAEKRASEEAKES